MYARDPHRFSNQLDDSTTQRLIDRLESRAKDAVLGVTLRTNDSARAPTMPFYLTPEQDDFNQELQVCIAEALYDVDSIVADPGAYTKEELAALRSQIVSNLEQAWELLGGSEDQLDGVILQISHVVARQFNKQE